MAGQRPKSTILVIEDEADLRTFASRVLELEGYRVLRAADGGEGLRLMKESRVSLVLLDLRLPDCDGQALLDQLKADAELASVPVIVFTALAEASSRRRARAAGVADYVVKPLSAASLAGTVRSILRREGGH